MRNIVVMRYVFVLSKITSFSALIHSFYQYICGHSLANMQICLFNGSNCVRKMLLCGEIGSKICRLCLLYQSKPVVYPFRSIRNFGLKPAACLCG